MSMLSVAHITTQTCPRYFKEIIALKKAGVDCIPIAERFPQSDFVHEVGPVHVCRGLADIEENISALPAGTICHVHSEPAGLAVVVKRNRNDLPVVLDVHDSEWGRGREMLENERRDLEAADSVIVPSTTYLERCQRPAVRVASGHGFRVEDIEVGLFLPPLPGVCYMGGCDVGGWRDYRKLFSAITETEMPLYVYSPDAVNMVQMYAPTGAVVQQRPYRQLAQAMARHTFGLVCPPADGSPEWASSAPNKLHEYLACGLYVLTYGCPEAAEYVETNQCGYCFANQAEMLTWIREEMRLPDWDKVPDSSPMMLAAVSMDDCVQAIMRVYANITEGA